MVDVGLNETIDQLAMAVFVALVMSLEGHWLLRLKVKDLWLMLG